MSFGRILKIVALFIPTILAFIGQATIFPKWLVERVSYFEGVGPDILKDWSLGIGTLLSGLLVVAYTTKLETQHEVDVKALETTIKLWRDILTDFIRRSTRNDSMMVNVRVLRPKKWHEKRTVAEWRKLRLEYKVIQIQSLADDAEPAGLCFEMWPNPQGLVGKAYERKKSQYDTDVSTAPNNMYNLTFFQQQELQKVKFVVCVPILNQAGQVQYIISLDSQSRLKNLPTDKEQKLVSSVIDYLTLTKQLIPIIAGKY